MTQHALVHLQNLRRGGNGILCAMPRAGPRLSNMAVRGGERRTQARPCPSSEGSLAPTLVLAARTCEALCSKAQTLFRPTLPGSQQTLQEDPGLQNGLAVLWRGGTEEMQGASLPKVLEPAEKEGPERRSSRHLPGVGDPCSPHYPTGASSSEPYSHLHVLCCLWELAASGCPSLASAG